MCARFLSLLPAIGAIAALSACSPMGTPAPAPAPADPATIHARILTLDTHLDTPVHFERRDWDFGAAHDFYSDMSQVDLPRMTEAGLDGGFFVLYTSQGPLSAEGFAHAASAAEHRLAAIEATLNAHRDTITRVTSAGEAARVASHGGHFALISVENSYPLGESVVGLADWRRRGVLMAGPVHNGGNQFGDSASGGTARWGGLSPLGRAWVAEMNRLGMIIDASHASDAALTQMLDLSAAPIILSHSGFKAIFDHPRNISDDQARAIAAKGGVIQVNSVFLSRLNISSARSPLYDRFDNIGALNNAEVRALGSAWRTLDQSERVNEGDFDLFMRALFHCITVVGADHCGIGADWDGGAGMRGFEDIRVAPRITAALLAHGLDEGQVAQIWGGNVLRLLNAAQIVRNRLIQQR